MIQHPPRADKGDAVSQVIKSQSTVLDALLSALGRASAFNRDAEMPPLVVLWPDGGQQWVQAVSRLREHVPILTLGDFDTESRTGPAIWIRAELATRQPGEATPIIYLPGISKAVFRNVEDAPVSIQSLLYLQYRGTMFLQPNGKDWTIPAFLQNAQEGLDIKVDGSEATRSALVSAVPIVLKRSVVELRNHPGGIDADYLSTLLISDIPKRILQWINDPAVTRTALDGAAWTAFSQQLRTKYHLDPQRDGASEAARLFGSAEPGSYWIDVWNRFAESPATYPAIPAMLRGAKPAETGQRGLFGSAESHFHWPQDNEEEETSLRQALSQLASNAEAAARRTIFDLDARHAPRQECVWATLGQAPLAFALQHLAIIARDTAGAFPAGDVQTMQDHYTASGWQIDMAALDALRRVTSVEDRAAIEHALDAIYTPWLWATAEAFQQAMSERKISPYPPPIAPPSGTCVLFADGLRYDLGARLTEMLRAAGHKTEISGTIGPLPGVTPSAKPAQSPVADLLVAGPKLNVCVAASGSVMNQTTLKKLIVGKSWVFLSPDELGAPDGTTRAWTELGNIDSYGHNHAQDLPRQAYQELQAIHSRIDGLLTAGWNRVVVVTDHGWLLTPSPMPKTDLPQHLTAERKGRCARLNPGAKTSIQTVPWCWDPEVAIAMAPGISCFEVGKRYDHGGLTLQESIVPTITVTSARLTQPSASIATISWRGLRCIVTLDGDALGMQVDIRQKAGDAGSSLVANVQAVASDGRAGVLIEDDAHEGLSANIVVLDSTGKTIAQRATIIGGD